MRAHQKKNNQKDLFELLPQAITTLRKNIIEPIFGDGKNNKYANERPPLRSELFTEEQLEQHAIAISRKHTLISGHPSEQLLTRLAENERILLEVHSLLTETAKQNNRIVPAGEWLLDNFYLIEEQIYTGKKHLPKGYSKGLPQLSKGESAGLPRVYDIAVEIISHSDGHVDLKSLTGFVNAYQKNTFLKIGELWAIPIMLRLALIENLRRLSIEIAIDISNKTLAGHWADEMMEAVEKDPKNLVIVIADMARSDPPMVSSFVAELTRRLNEKGNSLTLPLSWIEQRLSDNNITSAELVQEENQKQAAGQVSISNSINSLRFLSTTDWREFVESTSVVEHTLQLDASGIYNKMDFFTRDTYRHSVEKIAKRSEFSEKEIAEMAIGFAKENLGKPDEQRLAHVGYYLLGKGLSRLEKLAKIRLTGGESCRRFLRKAPLFFYTGSIIVISALFCLGLMAEAYREGIRNWLLLLEGFVSFVAASQLAVFVVNWFITIFSRPSLLPRMDFCTGIPDGSRTMVVVPTIITSVSSIDELIEATEVRFLANRDANLSFALLTDFPDAVTETVAGDDVIIENAKNKITELNKKYGRSSNDTFFIFHRPRKWNPKEKTWMGYERKRGKLSELNELIMGHGKEYFSLIVGDENIFTSIKYVITLDTDTQLPRDAAWKMAGTLSHPLNQALYSEKKKRVTEGYTILQPRVSNTLPPAGSSVYARIHGNEPGTDPYTKAVSDVYQDLFGEGSFIGKGIYNVAAFEKVLKNRFPENRILSHDLLEGCYSRAGLITDVQLYEDYPSSYNADMKRRHRWIRGDWQIGTWILPFVPSKNKHFSKNPVSLLSKWKIFDNIRRSLVPLCLLLLFLFAWNLSSIPWLWTTIVAAIIFLPSFIAFSRELSVKPPDVVFRQHFIFSLRSAKDHFFQQFIDLACLPYEVYSNADAILRTLWRIFISHHKLLQWNPYSSAAKQKTILQAFTAMWFAPFFSLLLAGYLLIYAHAVLTFTIALPLLVLWFTSPILTWTTSRSTVEKRSELTESQTIYLRKLARKIWAFFETFITAEDNWLPPDNYQEQPVERIAHRTSPTNIGLSLLSGLTAYDLGYISVRQLVERSSNTINSMLRMERYHGHLYNWYDTTTLAPLAPRYISTVDSGNLAGHLITLQQALETMADNRIINNNIYKGLLDTIRLFIEKTDKKLLPENFIKEIEILYDKETGTAAEVKKFLDELEISFTEIITHADLYPDNEDDWWAQKTLNQIQNVKADLTSFLPWVNLLPTPAKFEDLIPHLPAIPTINQLARIEQKLLQKIISCYTSENTPQENEWLTRFRDGITEAGRRAKELVIITEQLAQRCSELANIDYDFLYDRSQHLLAIGYNVDEHRRDNSFYDLLASEARLSTFVAIAQGKLSQESWFALGRQLTNVGNTPILISWSGSIFEYLMPLLVMPTYDNTLLDQTYKGIVLKQIDYGKKRNVPWGISESGYNMVDASLNYQYHAFGVPGTGFKRGLGEDLVIAPYATVMALMVMPQEACDNLQVLREAGIESKYGFYEAVDYTASRLQRRQTHAVIQSFMAHHQGMSLLSIAYLLLNRPMQERFQSQVQVKATLLLLQERIPRVTTFYSPSVHSEDVSVSLGTDTSMRVINTPNTIIPEVQLLSNGRYHVMVTNSGAGYSRWKNLALTRWREDCTCDDRGTFCFIRDIDNNVFWSSAFQPTLQQGDNYEAVFSQGRAEFRRRDLSLETHTEIVVSPEDDIELRRIHITNRSRKKRTIEITSYAEVVLTLAAADEAHPAFSNLFVQTEIVDQRNAIMCTRRPRTADENNPWMFHLMKAHDTEIVSVSYETDRDQFIGRGNNINKPKAMKQEGILGNSEGSVLDPVISIQYRIILEPQQSATIDMIFGVADSKDTCNTLIEKYQDRHLTNRVLELAWTHSQVILRQINAVESDAQLYARLAGSIIFSNASMRADPSVIIRNQRGQSGLWSYSISGDLPIVLLQIEDSSNIDLVRQLVQAHAYWRLKGLMVDLVIWNEDHGGYRQVLHNQIQGLVAPGLASEMKDQPGGIFIRSADQISNEDRILFQTVAHVVISDKFGSLEEQMNRRNKVKTLIPYFSPAKFHSSVGTSVKLPDDLQFFNGYGGFSKNGKEYVIITTATQQTPAPWINVLANPQFGSIISESGQSYTWVENAHEIRLTPWNNDPIGDLKGEVFYLRDEESGRFWSPTPLPIRGNTPYITRHGFGYSIFEHSEDGIDTSMTVFVDIKDPVKFVVLKIKNNSGRQRRISATGYVEWVLADLRSKSLMHIVTEMDGRSGALLAKNAYSAEFQNRVAFFDADDSSKTFTTDRSEFIGRNGTLINPEAMNRARLSGKTGAALDPCAVIQSAFDLEEDEEHEIIFRLGAGKNITDVQDIITRSEGSQVAQAALEKVKLYWQQTLSVIEIETPDAAVNILANGWLNYQTLACRIWARSGFYQSGGAFGFRDQLQDVLSLLHSQPQLVRQQILLSASRQFYEGDVQHWWHPPMGRGVRTTCSDDYLWLPFVTAKYVSVTGDISILNEPVTFLEGRLLNEGEESYYDLPIISDKKATLYEHCVKAIEHGLRFGEHGLPFMGSGDWNDGMDKVGEHGKGESIWLAFFLYDILIKFADTALLKNDGSFANRCKEAATMLGNNINQNAWDGEWYRRAYFDDGTPLGSSLNEECKIDSIAQSWSVLSGAGEEDRTITAMKSADKFLVKKEDKIIQLFDPPFDKSALNPGYIKGYVPGVRENGGQYTHAAIWLIMAFAEMGNREMTWELLQLINPVNHSNDQKKVEQYKVEPYVIAADVYAEPKHKGRGGWTWYTGSAGWMYQLMIESFIGIKKTGDRLSFNPCIPEAWPSIKIKYRYLDTVYEINIDQATKTSQVISIDGEEQKENYIRLINDGAIHQANISGILQKIAQAADVT